MRLPLSDVYDLIAAMPSNLAALVSERNARPVRTASRRAHTTDSSAGLKQRDPPVCTT